MKTKKVTMRLLGTLEKKVSSNEEELKKALQTDNYEGKMKAYREHWISDDFIEKNADWINWGFLCAYQPLKASLIEKYHLEIDFDKLISYQKLPQKILLKFRENIDVDELTKNHPLSEKFIERYHDLFCMHWANIVFYQNLSLDFLIKHKNKFELEDLEGGVVDETTIDNFKIFTKMGVI